VLQLSRLPTWMRASWHKACTTTCWAAGAYQYYISGAYALPLCARASTQLTSMLPSDAKPPLLLCVKPNLTGDGPGSFEDNLASLQLQEGREYLHFS